MTINVIKLFSEDEIQNVLTKNAEWIETKGKSGERAILDGHVLSNNDFYGAIFRGASLDRVVFDGSNCGFANFKGSKLRSSSFKKTTLTCANFEGVNLNGASFISAKLDGAILSSAKMNWIDLSSANLWKANLSSSNIRNGNLRHVDIREANLENAVLNGSNLFNAKMNGANLTFADLSQTNLSEADLSNSNITGAVLSQVRSEGWNIKNIKCDYIYFDYDKKERVPRNRNFHENEFEELYSWFPYFVYYFKDKMHALDPYIISVIVNGLNRTVDDLHLEIDEIRGRGLYPQIKFVSKGGCDINEIEGAIVSFLDGKLDELHNAIANMEGSLTPSIDKVINKAIKGISMTKLEFNAPVQNVIGENKGVVNIQSLAKQDINSIIDSVKKVKPSDSFSESTKKEVVKELSKLAAGEIKDLTVNTVNLLKTACSEFPADISEMVQSWLGQ